ncbi:hypothetical protein [Bosea sp. UC22_33]|uniref:hypothetical protein n=1 Tax=Bosea sp. UC22_33 TaxID=3350165 RepID=UPI00366CFBC4
MAGDDAEIRAEQGDIEAGRADIDADEHADAAMDAEGLGPPAASGVLDAGFVEQAFLDQARRDRIGLAAGKLQAIGERMAGGAPGPEGGLEQRELIRAQPVPGQGDRSLLSFPARPFW